MFEKTKKTILNLFFPINCSLCRKEGEYLCLKCLDQIPRKDSGINGVISVFDYQNLTIKKLIWKLKYENTTSVGSNFGKIIYDTLLEELSEHRTAFPLGKGRIILVPIPMHPKKLKERGFNQAEIIAQEIAKLDQKSFVLKTNLLKKIKYTKSQMTIKDRGKRLQNVSGSFGLNGKINIKGKFVILVDDIVTTGATVNECKQLLIKAGVGKVLIVSVAR